VSDKKPDGPSVMTRALHQDDRGFVYCALDNMDDLGIRRSYVVENFEKGRVRAWHGHRNGDTYIHVIRGAIKAAAMNMDDNQKVLVTTLTERTPQVLFVPAGWYNGAMSLTDGTKLMVYSTLTFEEVKEDDERVGWGVNGDIWKVDNR
jgi:dTDP-4-dehydrorhamnose 3,5-epimerase-like enzyme